MRRLDSYDKSNPQTADLPFGNLRNESAPGEDDGTPILAEQIQDINYALFQVLQLAGVTPNGELEDGNTNRQFIQALVNTGIFRHLPSITYNLGTLCYDINSGIKTYYESLINENTQSLSDPNAWKIFDFGGGSDSGPLLEVKTMPYKLTSAQEVLYSLSLAGDFKSADDKPVLFETVSAAFSAGIVIDDVVPLSNINNVLVTATIPCVIADNGARIVHIDDMDSIDDLFTQTGSAAYLVYDPDQQRIRLPRNNNFISYTDNIDYVGAYQFDRIVNIVGRVGFLGHYNVRATSGAFYDTGQAHSSGSFVAGNGNFTASFASSRVVNSGDRVMTRNIRHLLYFRTF
jgi:hypothetical protein